MVPAAWQMVGNRGVSQKAVKFPTSQALQGTSLLFPENCELISPGANLSSPFIFTAYIAPLFSLKRCTQDWPSREILPATVFLKFSPPPPPRPWPHHSKKADCKFGSNFKSCKMFIASDQVMPLLGIYLKEKFRRRPKLYAWTHLGVAVSVKKKKSGKKLRGRRIGILLNGICT